MSRTIHKLSTRRVQTTKKPGRYGDGNGLWLQVTPAGVKSWLFRYTLDGKARAMGLGPVHAFTLAEARERARAARQLLQDGRDPIAEREIARQQQRTQKGTTTFESAATVNPAGAATPPLLPSAISTPRTTTPPAAHTSGSPLQALAGSTGGPARSPSVSTGPP